MVDRDTLVAYALGMLDDAERREVEAYLRDHPEAEAEVRADLESLTQMVLDLEPVDVPEGSQDRLIERVRQERQSEPAPLTTAPSGVSVAPTTRPGPSATPDVTPATTPRRRAFPGWLGFAAAAALGGALYLGTPAYRDWQAQRELASYQAQAGAQTTELRSQAGERLGTAVRLPDGRAFVLLERDPQDGRVYQAWRVADGGPESLGVFQGRRFLSPPLPGETVFAVSVEPPGGSEAPTTTPITVSKL